MAPGRLVTDIVRALEPGAVTLEADDDELRIASGRSQFSVRTHPAGDFPRLTRPSGDAVTLPAAGLAEALRQVVRAASSEDSRPILTGVLMAAEADGLRLVATDSYRLAVRDLPGAGVLTEGQRVLVPSRALTELQRLLGGSGTDVSLRLGHPRRHVRGRRGAADHPADRGGVPQLPAADPPSYPNRLVVGREALLDAVRRVKLLARDADHAGADRAAADGIELTVITTD